MQVQPALEVQSGGAPTSARYRRYMIGLLTAGFGLNLFDRQIINVLAEAIKHDLHLADWQIGALTGLSFALLYSVAALPIARLADRSNRIRVIGFAILAWSVFTAACGMAASFVQLLALRVGVGIGEAGCAPPAQSLISDAFPPSQRSGALGIFGLGSPVGAALGLAIGGLLAESVGWRWTLVAAGAPGVVIGLLVLLTLKDSRVRSRETEASTPSIAAVLRHLLSRPTFVTLMLGISLLSFVNVGAMAFSTSFFLRDHRSDLMALGARGGLGPTAVVGIGMGFMGALGGGLGTFAGGLIGDRLGARNVRAYALIPAIGSALAAVGYLVMFTVPGGGLSLLCFCLPAFFGNLWNGPGTVALQALAGSRLKATAMAVVLFVTSVLGLGLGPLTIGILSDVFRAQLGPAEGLRLAILIGVTVGFVSALFHWLASRTIEADLMEPPQGEEPPATLSA